MFQLPVAILALLVQLILAFLYIVTLYSFCSITPDYGSTYADTTIKMPTSEQKGPVVYSSWFSYKKKSH